MSRRAFNIGFRSKLAPGLSPIKNKEIRRLETVEEKLQHVSEELNLEIDRIEHIKRKKEYELEKQSWFVDEFASLSGFAWIKGEFNFLIFQDFIGAAFGAVFFVLTQEVWDFSKNVSKFNLFIIFIISIFFCFALVYFSRRRKMLSHKFHQTVFLRTCEIYITSYLTALLFILIFQSPNESIFLFKEAVIITLPSVISAGTADLLFY